MRRPSVLARGRSKYSDERKLRVTSSRRCYNHLVQSRCSCSGRLTFGCIRCLCSNWSCAVSSMLRRGDTVHARRAAVFVRKYLTAACSLLRRSAPILAPRRPAPRCWFQAWLGNNALLAVLQLVVSSKRQPSLDCAITLHLTSSSPSSPRNRVGTSWQHISISWARRQHFDFIWRHASSP